MALVPPELVTQLRDLSGQIGVLGPKVDRLTEAIEKLAQQSSHARCDRCATWAAPCHDCSPVGLIS